MISPLRLLRAEVTEIVWMSPPAFRASTGRHSCNAVSLSSRADAAIALAKSNIIRSQTLQPADGSEILLQSLLSRVADIGARLPIRARSPPCSLAAEAGYKR
jgi:hypothetical protein